MKNGKAICFIISHGNLAYELNEVAQKFLPISIPVYLYSNKKDSIEKIIQEAGNKIEESDPGKVIVFVDLVGGSCWRAALSLKQNYNNIAVIGGVNLPALVSLATNISRLEWPELITKLEEDAVKAIKVIK